MPAPYLPTWKVTVDARGNGPTAGDGAGDKASLQTTLCERSSPETGRCAAQLQILHTPPKCRIAEMEAQGAPGRVKRVAIGGRLPRPAQGLTHMPKTNSVEASIRSHCTLASRRISLRSALADGSQ